MAKHGLLKNNKLKLPGIDILRGKKLRMNGEIALLSNAGFTGGDPKHVPQGPTTT